MKKSLFVFALAAVLVFAFATAAFATSSKTWNYNTDYYSWGSSSGEGAITNLNTLGLLGDNPSLPGVHAGYTAHTAKCGICHSVHRAKGDGVKLLNTSVATCAGCHKAPSTVTNVDVTWQTGGPHSSGTDASCNTRGCHVNNPHGANGSAYQLFASKLLTASADAAIAAAASNPTSSGVTATILNATDANVGAVSAARTGYTCNSYDCHGQTMLAVLQEGWAENRDSVYTGDPATSPDVLKTGHVSVGATNAFSFAAVSDCESCHDQGDSATRTGFTFPHSQTPVTAVNTTGRAYLWMTIADELGGTVEGMSTTNAKAMDGACLKCHRDGAAGIGLTH